MVRWARLGEAGAAWLGASWRGQARPGSARRGQVWQDLAWQARRGLTSQRMSRRGVAGLGSARQARLKGFGRVYSAEPESRSLNARHVVEHLFLASRDFRGHIVSQSRR